jgi:hypothetical protein
VLALRRAERSAKILLDDHIGRGLAPGNGKLDPALLKIDLAISPLDDGVAQFPLDLVERVDSWLREVAA